MTSDVPVGSNVRIRVSTLAGERDFEGTLLPPAGEGLTTLKLVNGYNLSYPREDVLDIEFLGDAGEGKVEKDSEFEEDVSLPEILLIHTGGTIASKVDYDTGAVTAKFEPDELLSSVPELGSIARIRIHMIGNMWSDDLRPRHWNRMIAASHEAFRDGYVGVVVTHGTDTMHISSAAMSYAWSGAGGRPPGRIAFTGSQRSPDRGSSDAAENLISAVYWAAHGPEVTGHRDSAVVVMHDGGSDGRCAVLPGCASRKSHSSKRGAFRPVNQEPVAYVTLSANGPEIEDNRSAVPNREITGNPMLFDEGCRIHELVAGPHLSPSLLEAVIGTAPDAMIIRGTGLGHIPILDPLGDSPENRKVADALSTAVTKGIPVIVTAETVHGPVNMNVYAKGRNQRSIGLIGHGSMCPPGSAVVKLHYLLSKGLDINGVREAWETDLVGENPPDSSS